jgi:aminopeptidase N
MFGPEVSIARLPGLSVGEEDVIRAQNTPFRIFDRVRSTAWSYSPGMYSFYSYTKPELLLRTLEGYLGKKTMARLMRTYHERWRFRHPSSDDFYAVANEVSGRDLGWYFKAVVEGTGVIDYEVLSATSERQAQAEGRFLGKNGRWSIVEPDTGKDDKVPWRTLVVVRRLGTVSFPIVVQLTWEDGSSERVAWNGEKAWTRIERVGPKRLRSAMIDPDNTIALEVNRSNNGKRLEPDTRLAKSWTSRWIFLIQNALAGGGL